ncbi:N-acetylglucosamine-binding protein A [Serratia ficaria]|uniref:M60 family metallopeptidase n=1 Tax=Serratia ficaria TaxID=61651 RepID=UPI00217C5F10|nr:M60 family metallopeptidase [Serratia ficaria]CAI1708438.1 N-acetylglucosamine-binding protein A [Serratia ficaria]
MKINKLALGIILASSPLVFASTACAAKVPWWEEYRDQAGFIEALPHIGYSFEDLQKNNEQGLQDSADSRTPLYWLKRTMEMYPPATPNRYNMPLVHHETKGWANSAYGTMTRGIFFFTRTLGEAGQRVTINAGAIPTGARCYAATGRDFSSDELSYLDRQKLTAGSENHYTFKQSGILLLGCDDPSTVQKNSLVSLEVNGGQSSNLFILGQSTQSDWLASKATANSFGFALLYDGHANTVVPKQIAQRTDEMIGKVLGDNLRTIALYERINGMDASDALFKSSQGSMFISYDNCCYADYSNGYVAVGFYPDRMNDKNGDDWGVWHELGHQYEPIQEYLELFPEIQVNRYSIEACRMFNQGLDIPLNQCHSAIAAEDGNWDKRAVENFLASGVRYQDYSAIDDVWEQLGFFTRLRFSYGENFFPKINQARLKAIHAAPGDSMGDKVAHVTGTKQKVIDFSVVAYSRAAGRDLRDYFNQWGMSYSAAAGQKVAAMNLPLPGEEQGQAPVVNLSRDKIIAVATYNTAFGYSVTADSDQNDVSYHWERISGDGRIYTKTNDTATVEVVIPKKVVNATTQFRVTASNANGSGSGIIAVSTITPLVSIKGGDSMANDKPLQLQASANFDEVKYHWKLLKGSQTVNGGIDQQGKITAGLAAGSYNVEVTASSDKGARSATARHGLQITQQQPGPHYVEWAYGAVYKTGDIVKNHNALYQCVVAGWCNQTGQWSQLHYEPGKGISWAQAWKRYQP